MQNNGSLSCQSMDDYGKSENEKGSLERNINNSKNSYGPLTNSSKESKNINCKRFAEKKEKK